MELNPLVTPVPGDMIRYIARQNPPSYGRLSSLSRQYQSMTAPVLPDICQAPIQGAEIARYIVNDRSTGMRLSFPGIRYRFELDYRATQSILHFSEMERSIIELFVRHGFKFVSPQFSSPIEEILYYLEPDKDAVLTRDQLEIILMMVDGSGEDRLDIIIENNSLGDILNILVPEGLTVPDISDRYDIYLRRTSCLNLDSHYALRRITEEFIRESRELVESLELRLLIQDFALILEVDVPRPMATDQQAKFLIDEAHRRTNNS